MRIVFLFFIFIPTVVFSSTKPSDYISHSNNSSLFASGKYRLSSDGNLLRSFESIDLGTNIFLLLGATPNINFKYQIFSFPLHVLSFHFESSFAAKDISSSRRYISLEKASIEKISRSYDYSFEHHIKIVESLYLLNNLELNVGGGDIISAAKIKGEFSQSFVEHRFYTLFSLQWLISKKISVITTMFWPVYYLSENITYEQDEQVEALLDPYFDFALMFERESFGLELGFRFIPKGLKGTAFATKKLFLINDNSDKLSDYLYAPMVTISWNI
jgi:hypothetical protein